MWRKIRAGLFAVCCIAIMPNSSAGDDRERNHDRDYDQKRLKGVFRGVATNTCLESQGGFTANLLFQVNGFAARYNEHLVSTAVFPGDGTMTETVRGTTYFQGDPYGPGALGAGTFSSTCRYTLNMNANKSFTSKGGCNGTLPLGPATGQGSIVEGIIAQGQVSEDDNVIIVGSTEPNAQTLTLSGGYAAQRLCSTAATYIRVK